MITLLSTCCKAPVLITGLYSDKGNIREHYVCEECEHSCSEDSLIVEYKYDDSLDDAVKEALKILRKRKKFRKKIVLA